VAAIAIKQHNLEQVQWAMGNGFHLRHANHGSCDVAERAACWDAVRYLLAQNHRLSSLVDGALKLAAKLGDVEFMQWLLGNYATRKKANEGHDAHFVLRGCPQC
jgi:hypothetical protein